MAGTDAAGVESATTASALDLEVRKAIQGLRKLFPINPGECHLFTRPETMDRTAQRWLSDRYVMLDVTSNRALMLPDGDEALDGMYKLTAGKGLIPLAAEFIAPNTPGLLDMIEGNTPDWYQMHRTRWSMADDDAKKMLCYTTRNFHTEPLAINEGIWTEMEQHFKPADMERSLVKFEYAPGRPYRVSYGGEVVAYVATADFPKGMNLEARKIVEVAA